MADHDVPDDVRARVVAVAVAARRPLGMQVGLLGRALHVGDRLERLVLDADPLGGAARLLGMLGGDERDRLAEVEDAVDREHRLVGELEPVASSRPGTSACVSTACTPGIVDAPREMSIETMRACACGLRSVWPQSIPGAIRSLEYANSPFTFGGASSARDELADPPDLQLRGVAVCVMRAPPPAAPRRRSSRSRCSGRGCPRAPRGSRRRTGSALRSQQVGGRDDEARRAEAALHRARLDERLLHGMQLVAVGEPLDRRHVVAVGLRGEHEARADERRRRAAPSTSRTRPARTRSSSRGSRASRAARRAATRPPSSRPRARSPLTRSEILMRAPARARARSARAARAGGSARVPRTSSIGDAAAATRSGNDVGLVARRGHEHRPRRRPSRTTRAARRPPRRASETTAITIALRGPTFMNVCGAPRRRQPARR